METPEKIDREIHIRISVGRREVVWFFSLAMMCLLAGNVATESLTLTTYYPAPYGAYKELRSTENAYFAYTLNAGSPIGKVGIGTETPQALLEVAGDAAVARLVDTDDPTGSQYYLDIGSDLSGVMKGSIAVDGGAAPTGSESINVGDGYIHLRDHGCVLQAIGSGATTSCPSGYATTMPGVFQEGNVMMASFNIAESFKELLEGTATSSTPNIVIRAVGNFYCCPK